MLAIGKFLTMYCTVCTLITFLSFLKVCIIHPFILKLIGRAPTKEEQEKSDKEFEDRINSNSEEAILIRQMFGDLTDPEQALTAVIVCTYIPVLNLALWAGAFFGGK